MKAAFLLALVCVSSTEGFSGRLHHPPCTTGGCHTTTAVPDTTTEAPDDIYCWSVNAVATDQCTVGIDAYIPNVHWWVGKMPVSVGLAPGGLYKVVYKITALRTHRNCLNQLWPWLPCTGPAGAAAAAGRRTAAAHTGNF